MYPERHIGATDTHLSPHALMLRTRALPADHAEVPPCAPPACDEVHLWQVALDVPAARLMTLHQTLVSDERERAARLRFAQDRARFVAARGRLRQLLGHYLDHDPAQVAFRYD